MKDNEAREIIREKKKELGDRLIILGHHYQSDAVIAWADFAGDSLELARKASQIDTAEFVVFCGVYFMAESAAVLAPGKKIYIPDAQAGCPLADMADTGEVAKAWEHITRVSYAVMPVSYVNSSAGLKAFCGRHGGTICTSGNAKRVLQWAYQRSEKVFFMPDMNLGRNTARQLEIQDDRIVLWDTDKVNGGLADDDIARSKIILWKGWCPVHWPQFTQEDVEAVKAKYPGIKVIVHPEADPETVQASDFSGSTATILEMVRGMSPGESLAIGTEANMVKRAARMQDAVRIVPLKEAYCDDMARITLPKLADTLRHLSDDTYRVVVPDDVTGDARISLTNMLRI